MENSFLPEGYELPTSGGSYFKLKQGANKFRIVSKPVIGFLGWTLDNKPERRRTKAEFNEMETKDGKIRHFWAFAVWSFDAKAVQVMEITQATIQTQLKSLFDDEAWGSPLAYNITINRSGESLETVYTTQPAPPTELAEDAKLKIVETSINLNALFEGNDPFEV